MDEATMCQIAASKTAGDRTESADSNVDISPVQTPTGFGEYMSLFIFVIINIVDS